MFTEIFGVFVEKMFTEIFGVFVEKMFTEILGVLKKEFIENIRSKSFFGVCGNQLEI